MPENIRCTSCEATVLGIQTGDSGPKPIGRTACPVCGGSEFTELSSND